MAEWRNIKTAPKDGIVILAYFPNGWREPFGWPSIVPICTWMGPSQQWMNANNGEYTNAEPTHWQPLPSPPTEVQSESKQADLLKRLTLAANPDCWTAANLIDSQAAEIERLKGILGSCGYMLSAAVEKLDPDDILTTNARNWILRTPELQQEVGA